MKFFEYIIATIRLFLVMLGLGICYTILKIGLFFTDRLSWKHLWRRIFIKYVCMPVFGLRVEQVGEPPEGTALYMSNHRSLLDPVVINNVVPHVDTVAKAEVENYPLLGRGARDTGVIYVKRKENQSRIVAKNKIGECLEEGRSILIFPEGTVSKVKETLPFKKGGFAMAVLTNTPIIPIALIYDDKRFHWSKMSTTKYYFNNFGRRGAKIKLIFGEPIIGCKDAREATAKTQEWINARLLEH